MRGADVDDVYFWVGVHQRVGGVDFGFGRSRGVGKDGGEKRGSFFFGGCTEGGNEVVRGGGGTGEQEVGGEAGGDPACSWKGVRSEVTT